LFDLFCFHFNNRLKRSSEGYDLYIYSMQLIWAGGEVHNLDWFIVVLHLAYAQVKPSANDTEVEYVRR